MDRQPSGFSNLGAFGRNGIGIIRTRFILEMRLEVLEFGFSQCRPVWWITDHAIKPAVFHRFRELVFPIERVHAAQFIRVGHQAASKVIRPDEAVAALDVVVQVGQGAFLETRERHLQRLGAFAFEYLEQQAELGHFRPPAGSMSTPRDVRW